MVQLFETIAIRTVSIKQVTSLNDDDENEDRQNSSPSTSTTSSTGTTTSSLSSSTRRQKLKNGLDVLPEEEDDLNNEDGGIAIAVPERKMSENKLLQTDITYGKANKRIQVCKVGNLWKNVAFCDVVGSNLVPSSLFLICCNVTNSLQLLFYVQSNTWKTNQKTSFEDIHFHV